MFLTWPCRVSNEIQYNIPVGREAFNQEEGIDWVSKMFVHIL